jgi:hypothetical protein
MNLMARQHNVVEIPFIARGDYDDPYNAITLDVEVTLPSGGTLLVPAFWKGEERWAFRFAGAELGVHRYETICSSQEDEGLHGQLGTITVEAYEGANALLQGGRIRVAADQRHFEQTDGTPFFWMGDTWWMGLTTRLDWPDGFRELRADRVEKGFNVVQIIAGPLPDMDAWDERGRNEAGFPFLPDFAGVNAAYYEHADLKIAGLVEAGLMPCIVGMWGYYLPRIGVEKIKRFWRYLVARYGAYPVAWCLAGEGSMPYYLSETPEADAAIQRRGWTEVGAYVQGIDPFDNVVTIHPSQHGRDVVEDPSVLDYEMIQCGHDGYGTLPDILKISRAAYEREPRMPVVNSEGNYEGILGGSLQDVQRYSFYHSAFNGVAGYTYGANGIWQMSTQEHPYGPSPHGRTWGLVPWREAMHLEGGAMAALGGKFFAGLPWWDFEKHPEWVQGKHDEHNPGTVHCIGIPGKTRLIYSQLFWDCPVLQAFEADIPYRATYFDPFNGARIDLGEVIPDENGAWSPPYPPLVHDWVLLLEVID